MCFYKTGNMRLALLKRGPASTGHLANEKLGLCAISRQRASARRLGTQAHPLGTLPFVVLSH